MFVSSPTSHGLAMTRTKSPSPRARHDLRGRFAVGVLFLTLAACAGSPVVPKTDWLPAEAGWSVRKVDDAKPPRWALFDREVPEAKVKAIRLVGVVVGPPELIALTFRERLLDDANLPEGTQRKILRQEEDEIDIYSTSDIPFPFRDREVTERFHFSSDAQKGHHRIEVRSIDPGVPPAEGMVRLPLVHNVFEIEAAGPGRSRVTMVSVHDMGGHFPNWLIYGPVGDFMVAELKAVEAAAAEASAAPSSAVSRAEL